MRMTLTGIVSLIVAVPALAETIRVPRDEPTIQACIDAAADGDVVLVAPGVYKEIINFNGKAITLRGPAGRDRTIIDGSGLVGVVVKCVSGEGPDTMLQGFTITGGTGEPYQNSVDGAGMINHRSSPTIVDCAFVRNKAIGEGDGWGVAGGMWNLASSPTLIGCAFIENVARAKDRVSAGGAMFNENRSNPTIINCDFIRNVGGLGGAVCNYDECSPMLINCRFRDNVGGRGGAVYNGYGSAPRIENALFVRNTASSGGVLFGSENTAPTAVNCTFFGNTAHYEGRVMVVDGMATLLNCILWNNGEFAIDGAATITYSNVQGGWPGEGNIDADPLFVTGPRGELYLSHVAAGQERDSPCIDAGFGRAADYPLRHTTTRTDEERDRRTVDMGYHYPRH